MSDTTKNIAVLRTLAEDGPTFPHAFADAQGDHVHWWAPVFCLLRKEGLTEWTGERKPTGLGGTANVHRITPQGRLFLEMTGVSV